MSDTTNKPKLQLRSGISVNGDKTPSPATKLLLNHGKPNFTIQRSPSRAQENGNTNGSTEVLNNGNNNYNPYKKADPPSASNIIVQSTKFNGVFKPSNVSVMSNNKQPHQTDAENEASKVVLRRAPTNESANKSDEDDSVPEFIRRQRSIQERLAQQNILDFESRRSGYFTHVIVSPTTTSANRTSFVETMASPAVVPSLEIPPPAKREETVAEEATESIAEQHLETETAAENHVEEQATDRHEHNGHHVEEEEEEEVANAIEEVNKAVAGEEDESTESIDAVPIESNHHAAVHEEDIIVEVRPTAAVIEESTEHADVTAEHNGHADATTPVTNGAAEHIEVEVLKNGVTISHTNGDSCHDDGPRIPTPDPSGALGVNYEPKTVVSFSKDLGSDINKYPDTVKLVKEETAQCEKTSADEQLQELSKLKFDIKADDHDVQVTPVLRTD